MAEILLEKTDYNAIFHDWGEKYFGKTPINKFNEEQIENIKNFSIILKNEINSRRIDYAPPRLREKMLVSFIEHVFKREGIDLDARKLALLFSGLDWKNREKAEWTVANVLATFIVAYRTGIKFSQTKAPEIKHEDEKIKEQHVKTVEESTAVKPSVVKKTQPVVKKKVTQKSSNNVKPHAEANKIMYAVISILLNEKGSSLSDIEILKSRLMGKNLLEIFNEMFGTNAKDFEQLKHLLSRNNDIEAWALDLISLLEATPSAQNLTLSEISSLIKITDSFLKEQDIELFKKQWNKIKSLNGLEFVLRLRGLSSEVVDKLLKVEVRENVWHNVKTLEMPALSKLALARTLDRYWDYILSNYQIYDSKDGKLVLRNITKEDLSMFLRTLSQSPLSKHPSFFISTLPALIETSHTLDGLESKMGVISAMVAGLEQAKKFRGFNHLVINEYFLFAARKAYEVQATMAEDIRAHISGVKGDPAANLSAHFIERAKNIARIENNPIVDERWLDLTGDIRRSATGESNPYGVEWDVQRAVNSSIESSKLSPKLTKFEPSYIVRGLALNTVPFTEFRPTHYVYYGNEWMEFTASGEVYGYFGDIRNDAGGVIVGRLVGTGSLVEGKLAVDDNNQLKLNVIGKDLNMFGNSVDFETTVDRQGVDASVAAELDKLGGNVAVAFKGRGDQKELYIYYKDADGHWYRVGRLWGKNVEQWITQMDTYIPGFARIFANIKLDGKEGALGIVSLDMGELSISVEKAPNGLSGIAAYLLSPETFTIETITGSKKHLPRVVYAGYVQGNVVAGGQTDLKNSVVAGDMALGNVKGFRLVYETHDTSVFVSYGTYENKWGIASQVISSLGGFEWIAKYAAYNDANVIFLSAQNQSSYFQFLRNYKYLEYARNNVPMLYEDVKRLQEDLINRFGSEDRLKNALENPDSITDEENRQAIRDFLDKLRKLNAYSMLIASNDFTSFLAEGDLGFAEIIRSNLGGDVYIINAGYRSNNTTVGGSVGSGDDTLFLRAFGAYNSAELAAYFQIYSAIISSYRETGVRAILQRKIGSGEVGGIAGAVLKEFLSGFYNKFYLGVYYQEGQWTVQVLTTREVNNLGGTTAAGLKAAYLINPNTLVPVRITASGNIMWGIENGFKAAVGVESDGKKFEAFYSKFSSQQGSNQGVGVRFLYEHDF